MANCAQLINCLNSLYLAHTDKFVVTPVGHVFEMYGPHHGGKALRAVFSAPAIQYDRDGEPAELWGLQGSASIREKTLVLKVVNPSVIEPRETEISFSGAKAKSGSIATLSNSDIHCSQLISATRRRRATNQRIENCKFCPGCDLPASIGQHRANRIGVNLGIRPAVSAIKKTASRLQPAVIRRNTDW